MSGKEGLFKAGYFPGCHNLTFIIADEKYVCGIITNAFTTSFEEKFNKFCHVLFIFTFINTEQQHQKSALNARTIEKLIQRIYRSLI